MWWSLYSWIVLALTVNPCIGQDLKKTGDPNDGNEATDGNNCIHGKVTIDLPPAVKVCDPSFLNCTFVKKNEGQTLTNIKVIVRLQEKGTFSDNCRRTGDWKELFTVKINNNLTYAGIDNMVNGFFNHGRMYLKEYTNNDTGFSLQYKIHNTREEEAQNWCYRCEVSFSVPNVNNKNCFTNGKNITQTADEGKSCPKPNKMCYYNNTLQSEGYSYLRDCWNCSCTNYSRSFLFHCNDACPHCKKDDYDPSQFLSCCKEPTQSCPRSTTTPNTETTETPPTSTTTAATKKVVTSTPETTPKPTTTTPEPPFHRRPAFIIGMAVLGAVVVLGILWLMCVCWKRLLRPTYRSSYDSSASPTPQSDGSSGDNNPRWSRPPQPQHRPSRDNDPGWSRPPQPQHRPSSASARMGHGSHNYQGNAYGYGGGPRSSKGSSYGYGGGPRNYQGSSFSSRKSSNDPHRGGYYR